MKRRLFLTGPIGCGKSTAIERALGPDLARLKGFRTRRHRGVDGRPLFFYLESPDGAIRETFLDLSGETPVLYPDVFSSAAKGLRGEWLILDEIGGMELLNPDFMVALERVLSSDIPVIGVMKGEGPASSLVRTLGLAEEYEEKAEKLRDFLRNDPDTLLYECKQFDEAALHFARQWAEEYLHG